MAYTPYQYNPGYYNNYGGYNTGYQQYNGYQQQAPMQPQQQPAPQQMTPPTIHAEIIQVVDINAAKDYPVGAGQSQMLMTQDDSAIIIKTALANGKYTYDIYVRQAPEQPKPEINPADYITREEFEQRISAITPVPAQNTPKRAAKKEDAES